MPEQTPLISVIIPVYNVGEFLLPCLDSLMAQSYKNLEILLIDDGSTDGSGDRCDAYAQKDSRFRVIHKENGGVSSARNLGLDMAQGEYIAFIDADDWVAPDYFAVLYGDLVSQNVDAAYCSFRFVDETGKDIPCDRARIAVPQRIADLDTLLASVELLGAVWGVLFSAATLRGQRFSNMRYGEDLLFMYNWHCTNPTVSLNPYRGYAYVQRRSSALHTHSILAWEKVAEPLRLHHYAYENLPVSTPLVQNIFFARYAKAVHRAATAYALAGKDAAKQEDLRAHLAAIVPDAHRLPAKLRLYILLYAKAPWLYNFLARTANQLRK